MSKRRKKKSNKFIVLIMIAIISLISISAIILLLNKDNNGSKDDLNLFQPKTTTTTTKKKELKIVNSESNSRNIAIMINNIKVVWGYQSGIQDAYILYEMIAEGGITRLMGIYKDANTSRIGTVRSARIYHLDYVLENDAIYVHIGGSKEAIKDIKTLGIADFNSEVTFRDRSIGLAYEHTAFTSIEKIMEKVNKRGVRTTSDKDLLLNYSIEELDLSELEGSIPANNVKISFSGVKNTSFLYDKENKVYKRYQNDIAHVDYVSKEQYTVKNIITYQVKNTSYDSYGRQELNNIGSGTGYYITNGYAIPITWEKKSRESQTIYKYLDGKEIVLNDGNTHIEIQPKNRELNIN